MFHNYHFLEVHIVPRTRYFMVLNENVITDRTKLNVIDPSTRNYSAIVYCILITSYHSHLHLYNCYKN